jgi:hypothetical protein
VLKPPPEPGPKNGNAMKQRNQTRTSPKGRSSAKTRQAKTPVGNTPFDLPHDFELELHDGRQLVITKDGFFLENDLIKAFCALTRAEAAQLYRDDCIPEELPPLGQSPRRSPAGSLGRRPHEPEGSFRVEESGDS